MNARLAGLLALLLATVSVGTPDTLGQIAEPSRRSTRDAQKAQPTERWIQVTVQDIGEKGEIVRMNLPFSLAENLLPELTADKLQGGKFKLGDLRIGGLDLRGLLDAVRQTRDGEFVTVRSEKKDVRVAKSGGYLLAEVHTKGEAEERAEMKMPLTVVEAMLSGRSDELDIVAGIRALRTFPDTELLYVKGRSRTLRVWTDSRNRSE
jgi:hypothetical protein